MRKRDRIGSKRHYYRMKRKQEQYLRKLKPRKVDVRLFYQATKCIRNYRGRERQGYLASRTQVGTWYFNGDKVLGFQKWGNIQILRGHQRNRNRTITIAGIAFPTRRGKRPSYGGNTAKPYAFHFHQAMTGCKESKAMCVDYLNFIDQHNATIDKNIAYYTEANRYHRLYNPNGVASFWREVPRKRNR